MAPMTAKRLRISLALNFVLAGLCLVLFFYARNSNNNLEEAQTQIKATQLQSCRNDNVLRKERNSETRVIKDILRTIVKNSENRAKLLEKQGKAGEAAFTRRQAQPYADYNKKIHVVTLTNCRKLVNQESP